MSTGKPPNTSYLLVASVTAITVTALWCLRPSADEVVGGGNINHGPGMSRALLPVLSAVAADPNTAVGALVPGTASPLNAGPDQPHPPENCWLNQGQPCGTRQRFTNDNVTDGSYHELGVQNLDTSQFVVQYADRVHVYNPALTVFNGELWMVARHEGRNRSGLWTECPDTSLTTLRTCPVDTLRMVSFTVRCRLGPDLKPTYVLNP
jgi:hypothetical protein